MPQFDKNRSLRFHFQSVYADVLDARASQISQFTDTSDSSFSNPISESSFSFSDMEFEQLKDPDGLVESDSSRGVLLSEITVTSSEPSSDCASTPASSLDNQPDPLDTTNDVAVSGQSQQPPPTTKSRITTSASVPTRIRRLSTQSKSRKPKTSTDVERPWPRHILVCAKTLPNEVANEHAYFMIVLRSADVQSCGTSICYKLGIDSAGHKSMRWIDRTACLQGNVDTAFLENLPDMQDFLVDIVGAGDDGYVELLLEM